MPTPRERAEPEPEPAPPPPSSATETGEARHVQGRRRAAEAIAAAFRNMGRGAGGAGTGRSTRVTAANRTRGWVCESARGGVERSVPDVFRSGSVPVPVPVPLPRRLTKSDTRVSNPSLATRLGPLLRPTHLRPRRASGPRRSRRVERLKDSCPTRYGAEHAGSDGPDSRGARRTGRDAVPTTSSCLTSLHAVLPCGTPGALPLVRAAGQPQPVRVRRGVPESAAHVAREGSGFYLRRRRTCSRFWCRFGIGARRRRLARLPGNKSGEEGEPTTPSTPMPGLLEDHDGTASKASEHCEALIRDHFAKRRTPSPRAYAYQGGCPVGAYVHGVPGCVGAEGRGHRKIEPAAAARCSNTAPPSAGFKLALGGLAPKLRKALDDNAAAGPFGPPPFG